MRTFTKEELSAILESHSMWLENNSEGNRANLSYANLSYADLRSANLSYADLSYADLRSANLSYADLRSANLRYAVGNMLEIKSIQCDLWPVTYTNTNISIGCQSHSISEWYAFTDDEIKIMDSKALEWWKVWKPIIQSIIEASPAKAIELKP
jgi:hypothetical protein